MPWPFRLGLLLTKFGNDLDYEVASLAGEGRVSTLIE